MGAGDGAEIAIVLLMINYEIVHTILADIL